VTPGGSGAPLLKMCVPRRCTYHGKVRTAGRTQPPLCTTKRVTLASKNEILSLGGLAPSPARSLSQMPTSVHTLGPYPKQRHRDPIQLSLPETCGLAEKIVPFSTKFPTVGGTAPPPKRNSEICYGGSLQSSLGYHAATAICKVHRYRLQEISRRRVGRK
jgi:hypothetical protein